LPLIWRSKRRRHLPHRWYVGGNAGGTWSDSDTTVSSVKTFDCETASSSCGNTFPEPTGLAAAQAATGTLDTAHGGFIGGGQVGYNWQSAQQWVAGIEADIQGVGNRNSAEQTNTVQALLPNGSGGIFPGNFVTGTIATSKDIDWLGTVRGRLGWLWTPSLLVYGTGGLAYGHVSSSTSITGFTSGTNLGLCCGPMTFASAGTFSDTRIG